MQHKPNLELIIKNGWKILDTDEKHQEYIMLDKKIGKTDYKVLFNKHFDFPTMMWYMKNGYTLTQYNNKRYNKLLYGKNENK